MIRWEDGTESWVKVSIWNLLDLDEPLGEGSAVRHNGRRGTAATEPYDLGAGDCIKIRWDDGTLSDDIKVDGLDVDIPDDFSLTEETFFGVCRKNPQLTVEWFAALQLELVEEHSCLDDICICLG